MNKTMWTVVIVILVAAGGIYLYANRAGGGGSPSASSATSTPQNGLSGKGQVIINVTDKAANIQGVSEVEMTVSRVEVHGEAAGWVTLASQPKTFKLLQLKASGQASLAAKADLDAGVYNQVRLTIDRITVRAKNGARYAAKLPANAFTVDSQVTVAADQTSSVKVDVMADKSLQVTTGGQYVFAPVAEVEARSGANVDVSSEGMVTVTGGSVSSDTTAGMDLQGNVQTNFQLDPNAALQLQGGTLNVNASGSGVLNY